MTQALHWTNPAAARRQVRLKSIRAALFKKMKTLTLAGFFILLISNTYALENSVIGNYKLVPVPYTCSCDEKKVEVDRIKLIGFSPTGRFAYILTTTGNGGTGDFGWQHALADHLVIKDLVKGKEIYNEEISTANTAESVAALKSSHISESPSMEIGQFPVLWNSDQYSISVATAPYRKMNENESEVTDNESIHQLCVVETKINSKMLGSKVIGAEEILATFTQPRLEPAIFVRSPFENRLAVIISLGIRAPADDIRRISLIVYGAGLKKGYVK